MTANVTDKIKSIIESIIRDKKTLVKILSIALILMLALVFRIHYSNGSDVNVEAANEESIEIEELFIDIGGAVHKPGVYKVKPGTRLYEAIELAGGLRSDADTNSVNQAAFVEDGAKIIIPTSYMTDDENQNAVTLPGFININTADKEQLKTLDGIGDVIAERIIEYRTQNRFKSKEDILSVNGIGNSIYEQIKDKITV